MGLAEMEGRGKHFGLGNLFKLLLCFIVKLLEFSVFARKKCFAPMLFGKMKEVFWCFRGQVLKHLHNQ